MKMHRGYIVAAACAVLTVLSATIINSIGIFYIPVTQEFGISMTKMSLAITVFNISYTVCMPLLNRIINKYDLRVVTAVCIIGFALSFVIRALAKNIVWFYVSAVIQGNTWMIIVGLLGPIIANNWFHKGTATVIALISLCTNIGGFIFNAIGGVVIQTHGWRTCYWVWVLITLVVGLPFCFFIHRSPEEMGLQPFGYAEKGDSIAAEVKNLGMNAKAAMRTPAFWLIGGAMALDCFGDNFSSFISAYAQVLGVTAITAGLMSSCVQFGGIGSKLLLGPICDKKANAGAILSNGFGMLAFLGFILIGKIGFSTLAYGTVCVIYGCAYSASNIGFASITSNTFGPREFSKLWPSLNMFIGVFGIFAGVTFGMLIDNFGYLVAQKLGALIYLLATVFVVIVAMSCKKYKEKWTE